MKVDYERSITRTIQAKYSNQGAAMNEELKTKITKPQSHLDNDKEEYRKDLEKFIESWIPIDKKDPHYVMEAKVGARIEFMELVEAHTQSKLKAFAGEVDKAIGEDEYPDQHFPTVLRGENIEKYDKVTARDGLRAKLRESLKAIKEKAGIE